MASYKDDEGNVYIDTDPNDDWSGEAAAEAGDTDAGYTGGSDSSNSSSSSSSSSDSSSSSGGSSSSNNDDTAEVNLTDVQGEDGYRLTEEQLQERVQSGNTEDLSPAETSSQSAVEESVQNINQQSELDRQATTRQERNQQTMLEDVATTTKAERRADVNLSDYQNSEGVQLTEKQLRRRIAKRRTQGLELGPGARTSRKAILESRRNRRQNRLERQAQKTPDRAGSDSQQLFLNVNGRTGKATEEGKEFFQEQQRLRELPTFSLSQPSVAGELGLRIGDQFGEASRTIADVGQDLTGTEGDISTPEVGIPLTNKEIDIDNLFEGRGQPREAFQDTLAPLSVIQSRSNQFIDEQTDQTVEALEKPGLQDSGEIPTTGEFILASTTSEISNLVGGQNNDVKFTEARQAQERITAEVNKKFAAEVPEKTTESASILGAGAAGLRDPERLGGELIAGSGEIARKSVDKPLDFAAGEFVPDVTLDVLTGGGAAVATPQVRATARSTGGKIRSGAQEIQSLRRGGKESPSVLDQAAEAAIMNKPETQVLSADTASPIDSPGPASSPRPNIEDVDIDPVTPEPLQVIETDSKNAPLDIDTSLGLAVGVSGASAPSRPDADLLSRPESDAISRPETEIEPIAEPITEPLAQPESIAQPAAITEPVAEPAPEPLIEPIPQPEPVPQPRTLNFDPDTEEQQSSVEDEANSIDSEFQFEASVGAEILGITAEEAPSQEEVQDPFKLRPVVEENNQDEEDPLDGDLGI